MTNFATFIKEKFIYSKLLSKSFQYLKTQELVSFNPFFKTPNTKSFIFSPKSNTYNRSPIYVVSEVVSDEFNDNNLECQANVSNKTTQVGECKICEDLEVFRYWIYCEDNEYKVLEISSIELYGQLEGGYEVVAAVKYNDNNQVDIIKKALSLQNPNPGNNCTTIDLLVDGAWPVFCKSVFPKDSFDNYVYIDINKGNDLFRLIKTKDNTNIPSILAAVQNCEYNKAEAIVFSNLVTDGSLYLAMVGKESDTTFYYECMTDPIDPHTNSEDLEFDKVTGIRYGAKFCTEPNECEISYADILLDPDFEDDPANTIGLIHFIPRIACYLRNRHTCHFNRSCESINFDCELASYLFQAYQNYKGLSAKEIYSNLGFGDVLMEIADIYTFQTLEECVEYVNTNQSCPGPGIDSGSSSSSSNSSSSSSSSSSSISSSTNPSISSSNTSSSF